MKKKAGYSQTRQQKTLDNILQISDSHVSCPAIELGPGRVFGQGNGKFRDALIAV